MSPPTSAAAHRHSRSPAHPLARSPARPAIQARLDRGRQQRVVRPVLRHQGGVSPIHLHPIPYPALPRSRAYLDASVPHQHARTPTPRAYGLSPRPPTPPSSPTPTLRHLRPSDATSATSATRWLGTGSGARACAARPSTPHGTRRIASRATCATSARSLSACECTTATSSR